MALCAVTVLAGCRENQQPAMQLEPNVTQKKTSPVVDSPMVDSPVVDSLLQSQIDSAKKNLAHKLSIDESMVQVVSAEKVKWRS